MNEPVGDTAWAIRILEREVAGEELKKRQRDLAREGLGLPTAISAQEALDRLYDIDAEAA